MANKIVHAEVVGKDGPALHRFYGELFDWKQNTDLPGGYAMTDPADSNIVLGTGPAPDGSAGWVTFYVSVSDLDGTLAKAEALGGRVVMPRFSPAPDTFLAMVADPEGHVIGLSHGAWPEPAVVRASCGGPPGAVVANRVAARVPPGARVVSSPSISAGTARERPVPECPSTNQSSVEGLNLTRERNARTGLAIGCAAVFLAACGAASQSQPSTAPSSSQLAAASVAAEDPTSAPMPDAPASGIVLRLIAQQPPGKDVGWDVWELQAPAGKTFDVDYENTDDAKHDFAVTPEDGLLSETIFKSEVVKPLAAAVITVPALPAGTYDFICTLHSTEMRGTLTVR